jgi:hypothetical protein
MENVNGLAKLGDIHHTKGAAFLPNANLAHTQAYAVHGLPVVRLQPPLHPVKLIPRSASRHLRKPAKRVERIAKELNGPGQMHVNYLYKILYGMSNNERMGPLSGGPALEAWMDCQVEKLDEGNALDNEVGITRMVFAAGV